MLRGAQSLPRASTRPLIGMSDPVRLADPLMALAALPRGMILVLRPATPLPVSRIRDYRRMARRRNQSLFISSAAQGSAFPSADGRHLPSRACYHHYQGVLSAAAHDEKALIAVARAGAQRVLISPVYATASHICARPLGVVRLAHLATRARQLGLMPYALGGITTLSQVRRLRDTGISGIAGISFLQA